MTKIIERMIGTRRDWRLEKPTLSFKRRTISWAQFGPFLILLSIGVSWFAFAGAKGDGNVAFGLFIGAVSILLMAWSFILAIRLRFLEPIFGGLDRMYRVHRWAGTLAIAAMYLHISIEPEIDGGIRGASEDVADTAEDLAGLGEKMLYVLVGISLIRWFPYKYWRLTHKLLGLPFAFASWHFYTAEKTYANNSPWGWYFGAFMLVGLLAYFIRVVGKDVLAPGYKYKISNVIKHAVTTELQLLPTKQKMKFESGQFAVIKIQKPGFKEPHIFTIASSPSQNHLSFFIRELGDWTGKVIKADLLEEEVIVEGPYGKFQPLSSFGQRTIWVAGGVGITPFLSVIDSLDPSEESDRPILVYCVGARENATALKNIEQAVADKKINVEWFESSNNRRLTAENFSSFGDLTGAHIAVCGPVGLVKTVENTARKLGAKHIETEDFDIRSGIGPDLS